MNIRTEFQQPAVDAQQLGAYSLLVAAGLEHFEHGRTSLTFRGTGDYAIENVLRGERSSFRGQLSIQDAQDVFSQVFAMDFGKIRGRGRPGIPDEVLLRFELRREEKKLAELQLWEGEAEAQAGIARLLVRLRGIVREVTKGRVVL